ncbi:type VI secretion system Vgr family protein [Candidatus Odyssella acanthamoebae]|uniref:type VI secretion system Vgr family protein n=1 Tax=Candidatus Odyssella acanthamoebae TaxID=91604 RepID=UPI00068B3C5D|nr:type VI secretion system tip protein TssI/VgrG [Candidatus Paracaedibacter acanthamoebae]
MYREQSDLSLTLASPLGSNILILDRLRMVESISAPFVIELDMHSFKHDISFDDIIGQEILITFKYQNETRYFAGTVGEFAQGFTIDTDKAGNAIELTRYTAKLYPKVWLLKFSQDHQIFQEKSAMDIIKSVLTDNGVTKKQDNTSTCGQASREYCVQYRESYFAFVSRLMEEEGIFYYFDHGSNGEKMMLCDDSSSTHTAYSTLPMTPATAKEPYFDQIQSLTYARQVVSKKFQTADYNFETASTKLYNTADGTGKGLTVYRYPGYYKVGEVGDDLATHRIQELEWRKEMISGTSTAPLLTPMQSFTVTDHPRDSLNSDFIVYKVVHEINMVPEPGQPIYTNTFEAFPSMIPFRPPLLTPKPTIASTQTAKVTGKAGEEIWCDEYGRIKVKFYWDQKGSDDEKSSCWIRVAQLWASSGWGGLWTPRIGMEVVVTFLEGDPDRPLVTGCVYNSDNIPPYAKDEPTKSTIKSNTSKDGDGFNEIRFEDKKDSEEIFIHAQKDMNTVVEDNRTLIINDENDTTDIMCGDRTVTLHAKDGKKMKNGGNDTLTLEKGSRLVELKGAGSGQGNHTLTLTKGDNSIEIAKGNMTTTLTKGDKSITLSKGNMEIKLAQGNEAVTIKGTRAITVSDDETHKNSANFSHKVGGDYELKVSGNLTITVGGALSIKTTEDLSLKVGGDFKVTADGDINLESVGKSSISAGGNVEASGTEVILTGKMGGTFNGGASIQLKGGEAKLEGGMMTQIKGSVVQIN